MKKRKHCDCDGCRHWRPLYTKGNGNEGERICHYLLDTGKARGCEAGKGCRHYEPRKPGEKMEHADLSQIILSAEMKGVFRTADGVKVAELIPIDAQQEE